MMTEIELTKVEKAGSLPAGQELVFGKTFTDHMFAMNYLTGKGWHNRRIVPYADFPASPAMLVLHYGQAIFEGMKAFRSADNRAWVFRPYDYLNRFNRSAKLLNIPQMDVEQNHEALLKLLALEKDWIPGKPGTALYIRPFVFADEPQLGVKVADSYKMFIILSPVGAYYKTGFKPISIKVEDKYVRATIGGLGEAKTPANYAMSLAAQQDAYAEGFGQVLWLDAVHRKYIEEVGTMNILFKINGEVITPALNGSILGGMTRKTVLELCRSWGVKATERQISIEEVFDAHANGELEEVFGSGTAAVISPVGELTWKAQKIVINNNQTGAFSQKLFDYVTGVQSGKIADQYNWMEEIRG
jgi:branched-chain amino acid aminotransferase